MKIQGGVLVSFEAELRLTEVEARAFAKVLDQAPQSVLDLLRPPEPDGMIRTRTEKELSYQDAVHLTTIGKQLAKKLELIEKVREMVKGAEVVEAVRTK